LLQSNREKLMDKLAKRLREDAERINADISPELDERIRASLEGIRPGRGPRQASPARSAWFWFASSLTGVAAALAVVLLVNLRTPNPAPVAELAVPAPLELPAIRWRAQAAVLTSPLEQEIEDLQSDLKKAEELVREDMERLF